MFLWAGVAGRKDQETLAATFTVEDDPGAPFYAGEREAVRGEDAALGAAVADAGYWSEANAESQTEECELFIATQKDRKQRAALREAPAPRGRMPRSMTARERMGWPSIAVPEMQKYWEAVMAWVGRTKFSPQV